MVKPILTIAIPTYNRKKFLLKKLKFLKKIDNLDIEIIIVQNNSNSINLINKDHYKKYKNIKIFNNKKNIGGNLNIIKCIELANSEWIWILGDDDDIHKSSIELILNDLYSNLDKDIICINYSTSIYQHKKNQIIKNINNFFNIFNNSKRSCSNILFISANVLKLEDLKKNIDYGYNYSESFAPHLAILLYIISKYKKYIYINEKKIIVSHDNDENLKWSRFIFAIKIIKLLKLEILINNRDDLKKFISNLISHPLNFYFLIFENSHNKYERRKNNILLYKAYSKINNSRYIKIIFIINYYLFTYDLIYKILKKIRTIYKVFKY